MANITIDPITRIEGHLGVELVTNGSDVVTAAQSEGTMFRGFELLIRERNPRDAVVLTSRICGV
jgi:Ni,Fe-hydrogenase I large subunit